MHTQAVTFAFTMPRPHKSWGGLFDVYREAIERAAIHGMANVAIRRIDARWRAGEDQVDRWHPPNFANKGGKSKPLVPVGHIAVLVEGMAEKE